MQGIFRKENTDKALKYGIYRHLPTYEKIIRNLVSFYDKNGWIDNQRRVFIYYSIKNICEDLNCGTQKACKLLDELEKVGALERKRQGLGRPNKLYLKKMF